MMKNSLIIVLVVSGLFSAKAQTLNDFFTQTDAFLKAYVSKGKVDYKAVKENAETLTSILTIANQVSVSKTDAKNYQAFWINAYNLSVIKGIVDNYPIASPLDKAGFFDKITYSLAGQKVTLNTIENELLRGNFKDARFHFVLVCGAIGCPPLIANAYLPKTLEAQLDQQSKLALNGDYFVKVNDKKKTVEASEIMKWYNEDFVQNGMTEIEFINKYRINIIPENYKLKYFSYNWNLNKQ
ncbi:DUF547 domain-containing protein [Olleya marilimosa]|uniref:DUF547 domain-containing protein n=1 Tax=Olleya marilimosa TaxID=272164 RepID=A0ABR8LXE3_9FLAO|nr:DUF547 domain-containing protein [Olleya marilimosa]MBD3864063.1 DUF547 domain-containing protein [Olleya marilimosa]